MIPDIVSQLTADTSYSPENFKWLMDNSSARSYLGKEVVGKIMDAVEKNDDAFLKKYFERIKNTYLEEKDLDLKMALMEEIAFAEFDAKTTTTGENLKKSNDQYKHKMESLDDENAESILNILNNS